MRSYDKDRQFGDKLIPKLQTAVVEAIVHARKNMLHTERDIRLVATKAIADVIGDELAEIMAPLTAEALADSKLPDDVKDLLTKISSGDNQYQAIAGAAFGMSGVPGLLGQATSNAFAPLLRRLLSADPLLDPPWQVIIDMVARNIQDAETARGQITGQGIAPQWFDDLILQAQSLPDVPTLLEWLRRSLMDESTARGWMGRQSIPEQLWNTYIDLARVPLSPADAALALLRGDADEKYAQQIANWAGITDDDFAILVGNTGEPPGLMQLLEAYRRGFIDKATLERGIRQSRIRDEWIPTIEALRYEPLSTADAIEAGIQGYITKDEAKAYSQQNGLEPADFNAAWLAAGEPLSRTEMMQLWRRGFVTEQDVKNAIAQSRTKDAYIDWAVLLKDVPMSTADAVEAYVQGYLTRDKTVAIIEENGLRTEDIDPLILTAGEPLSKTEMLTLLRRGKVTADDVKAALRESRLKDAYIDDALLLETQLPSLYEIRALLTDGALTAEQGTQLLLEQGYSADIVKAIVTSLTGGTAAATKTLTESMLTDLYLERELNAAEYIKELIAIGYTQETAEELQELADMRSSITARNAVISRIRAQYISRRITQQAASAELDALQISANMRDQLFDDWNIELETLVRQLTPAQVVDAWQMNLLSQDDPAANTQLALGYLTNLGYSGGDAITLLEIKNKGPLGTTNATSKVSPKTSGNSTQ
jgi:SOS response regulatory protein OraA/RecX